MYREHKTVVSSQQTSFNQVRSYQMNSDFLKVLRKCTPAQRKAILETAHDDLLEALRECCMNVNLKTFKVSPRVLKRLAPSKEELRFVADNGNPLNERKEVLLQKGEGFLPLILRR